MKVPPKGMVRYESSAKPPKNDGGGRATTLAVGEEGGGGATTKAIGEEGGGGQVTTLALGEEGSGGGRATTEAVGEEGGSGGGGRATTMAVGEEGGSGGGGGGRITTMAVGEEGGTPGPRPDVTTLAVGEEGSAKPPKFTEKVTTLLSDKKINAESNDYKAYGRTLPGHAAPLFGQQFKFGKAEAVKLSKAITTNYEPAAQKKVLKEIHARSESSQAKGTVALTRDGAAELNKLAKKLGLDLHFSFNQPRPIHPVG